MLQQLYDSLNDQLLAIEGMISHPHVLASGNAPAGDLQDFLLNDEHFAGLRLTDRYLMLYLVPLYKFPDLDAQFGERLKPVRNGKSCLKISKPEKLDRDAVNQILERGVALWQPTSKAA